MKIGKPLVKFLNGIFVKIIIILFLICLITWGAAFGWQRMSKVSVEHKSALIEQQLEKCQELVSLKNYYSDVISIKKSRIAGVAKSYSIVKFSGIVRTGIEDLSKAKFELSQDENAVKIILPPCEILGNEISGIDVFDESRSIFVAVTVAEIIEEINASKNLIEAQLIDDGILEEAKTHAADIVRTTFMAAGFSDVEVIYE